MPAKWIPPDGHNIVERYVAGETPKDIGSDFGKHRGVIRTVLRDAGVLRSPQEAAKLRGYTGPREASHAAVLRYWKDMDADARKIKTDHMRAGRHAPTLDERRRTAVTRQLHITHVGAGEREIIDWLRELGGDPIHQLAVERYNADIGLSPILIEVVQEGTAPWHVRQHFDKVKELTDLGYHVLAVWLSRRWTLDRTVAEYALTFRDEAQRLPAGRGEYRVIRSSGELLAVCRHDLDKLSAVKAPIYTDKRTVYLD